MEKNKNGLLLKLKINIILFFSAISLLYSEEPWSISSAHPVTQDVTLKRKSPPKLVSLYSDVWIHQYTKYMEALDFGSCAKIPSNEEYFRFLFRHYNAFQATLMVTDRVLRCSNIRTGKQKIEYDPPVFIFKHDHNK